MGAETATDIVVGCVAGDAGEDAVNAREALEAAGAVLGVCVGWDRR